MTTPTTQPSAEAMAAAKEIVHSDFGVPVPEQREMVARIIDTHLAPLRERAERAEELNKNVYKGYLVKIDEERAETKKALDEVSRLRGVLERFAPGVFK